MWPPALCTGPKLASEAPAAHRGLHLLRTAFNLAASRGLPVRKGVVTQKLYRSFVLKASRVR